MVTAAEFILLESQPNKQEHIPAPFIESLQDLTEYSGRDNPYKDRGLFSLFASTVSRGILLPSPVLSITEGDYRADRIIDGKFVPASNDDLFGNENDYVQGEAEVNVSITEISYLHNVFTRRGRSTAEVVLGEIWPSSLLSLLEIEGIKESKTTGYIYFNESVLSNLFLNVSADRKDGGKRELNRLAVELVKGVFSFCKIYGLYSQPKYDVIEETAHKLVKQKYPNFIYRI